ncbi:MAG TPA: NTP transferase domain-containing protein [Nitrososphaeraceae archaeon]|nr:NTP transferase domain-containing protein [Nitrososphaeraceae archaeon]
MTKKQIQVSSKKKLIAIIMCGGEGGRMKRYYKTEKLLLKIKGKKIIEYVIEALIKSDCFDKIGACTSQNSIRTRKFLQQYNHKHDIHIQIIEGNGNGYSSDLLFIIKKFFNSIIFIISADLPLLSQIDIMEILNKCDFKKTCNTIIFNKKIIDQIGIKPSIIFEYRKKNYCYSGIAIFNLKKEENYNSKLIKESFVILNRIGIAVNVNEKKDLHIARYIIKRLEYNKNKLKL